MGLFTSKKNPLNTSSHSNIVNRASLTCQVRMNIRCGKEMSYSTLADIFNKKLPYDPNIHTRYLLGFFEECPPSLIKAFMKEQKISKTNILEIFNTLPASRGETFKFRKALENGEF